MNFMGRQMKKSWRIVIGIAALSVILSSVSGALAQCGPIAGGYAETSISNPEVVAAAKYAVRRQAQKQGASISLISIRRAEVQVVSGLNYRLGLRVNVNGKTQDVTAVVYKNLKRRYSLSNWEADGSPAGSGANASSNQTIEQLVNALAEAYTARALGRLDAERPYYGGVGIVIENSLGEDAGRFVIKRFKTLAQADKWLKSREGEALPARETRPLVRCKSGLCTYDFSAGILHNHLYLQKISYGLRRGRPYIKTIFLLDGD